MTTLTGLFTRGPSYYLRVVLPDGHPANARYRSGRVVLSLGACSRRDAISKGILLRAEVLRGDGAPLPPHGPAYSQASPSCPPAAQPLYLRDVYAKWAEAKPRSADTLAACLRAVVLFEDQTGNPPLASLNRAAGIAFRAWLQQPQRATTAKTARDRLVWVKSLLKHAQVELEAIPRSPWEGLDIEHSTTHRRRPWSSEELSTLFTAPLHRAYVLPKASKAGGEAAYWIPLLGLYSGARVSELVQLRRCDIEAIGGVWVMSVTDDGDGQRVKTSASVRKVPIHDELLRLGFLEYADRVAPNGNDPLWPNVPTRDGKAGGLFSAWFGAYRRKLGFGRYPDFHCFRHTMRSALANAEVSEPMIDAILGHEVKGSTGAKVYTHRTIGQMKAALDKVCFPMPALQRPSCIAE